MGRVAFAAARWPSFGLNCSVYYPCGISNYLFLLDRPLARMTLISLAARLHTFNWCVTSRQRVSSLHARAYLLIYYKLQCHGDPTLRVSRECRGDFVRVERGLTLRYLGEGKRGVQILKGRMTTQFSTARIDCKHSNLSMNSFFLLLFRII